MAYLRVTEVLHKYNSFEGVRAARLQARADQGQVAHKLFSAYANGLYIPEVRFDCAG